VEDKQQLAIQGQASFDEANTDCQILDQVLDKCMLQLRQLQGSWRVGDEMKSGTWMMFKPKPILHFETPCEESGRTFISLKPCRY
jgi:hypothetical protein